MSSIPTLDAGLLAGARTRLEGMRELAARVRWLLALRGAFELVRLLAICVIASFLLDRLLSFEVSTRALLSLGAFGWLAWRFETRLLRPSLQRASELELAAGFDRLRGEPGGAGPLLPCVARLSEMLVQTPVDEEERALLEAAGRQALEDRRLLVALDVRERKRQDPHDASPHPASASSMVRVGPVCVLALSRSNRSCISRM